jgi:hypothetical protein
LQEKVLVNNLSTIFDINSIPKDSQMRDVTDLIPTEAFSGIFPAFINYLQRGRQLSQYRVLDKYYLVPLDGPEYFSSDKICCPQCLKTEPAKGRISR